MDKRAVLALYDSTMRHDPAPASEVRYERVGGVVRSVGLWNVVLAWDFTDIDAASAVVAAQAAYARAAGVELEWKLFGHDRPAGLASVLQSEGFVADESETLMVLELDSDAARELRTADDVDVRRVVDAAGVDDLVSVTAIAFGRVETARAASYLQSLGDPRSSCLSPIGMGGLRRRDGSICPRGVCLRACGVGVPCPSCAGWDCIVRSSRAGPMRRGGAVFGISPPTRVRRAGPSSSASDSFP